MVWCHLSDEPGPPAYAQAWAVVVNNEGRVVDAQTALHESFTGWGTSSGNTVKVRMAALRGREQEFVDGLGELLDLIVELSHEADRGEGA